MWTKVQKEARSALLIFLLMMTATGALAAGFTAEDDDDDMTTALVQCGMVVKLKATLNARPSGGSQTQVSIRPGAPTFPETTASSSLPQSTNPPQFAVPLRR
jgi:hypothetical protein